MDQNLYIKLSPLGTQKHKELETQCFYRFIYWIGVANLTGGLAGQLMMYIPMKSLQTQKRARNFVFLGSVLAISYHGYKLSKRDLRRGQKVLLQDKENILSPE